MLLLIVTLIISVPVVLFALSNTEPVRLALWPTDYALEAPLSVTILVAMAIAFILGALIVWLSVLAQRSRARRAERTVRMLEAQVQELKARTEPALSLPPAA
ncbi:MAG TPA: LapA family protein [Rhodopila sp.]|nr:LapA family protein [Rhodopila sp.]